MTCDHCLINIRIFWQREFGKLTKNPEFCSGHVPEVNTTTKCLGRSFAATAEDTVNKDRVKLQREKKEIYLGINPRGEKFPTYDRSHLYGPEWAIAGKSLKLLSHWEAHKTKFSFKTPAWKVLGFTSYFQNKFCDSNKNKVHFEVEFKFTQP